VAPVIILVIADIHGNMTALEAVMSDAARRAKVDDIWCLGDLVGYGPDPGDCISFLREVCNVCVAGNHDLAAAGKTDTSEFNPNAADAIGWTRRQLSKTDIDYLCNLPPRIEAHGFTLVHGSPRDPLWEYVSSLELAAENLLAFDGKYCLVGHTHRPLAFSFSGLCGHRVADPKHETTIPLAEGARLILNPGAVGQPRDGDPQASYAIIDDVRRTFSLFRVPYDVEAVQRRMREQQLPSSLIRRLKTGT
jgi:diadenosine tetraphosphatase ApaH/serine/threonine PP2A family protein phosphatase